MGEKKSSTVVLRDNMLFTGYSSNGFSIPIDARKEHGGYGAGVAPIELMLTALAGCAALDVISILRKKQQTVTAMEVRVDGTRAEEHPRVFTDISVHVVVTGHNVDPGAVDRAIELSRDKYCGAAATLRHTAQITYTREIIEGEGQAHREA
jgi:putative redox protein